MGIHLITFSGVSNQFQSKYFKDYDELVMCGEDYPDDAIVYEADEQWRPNYIKNHLSLSKYANPDLRAGRRGELQFQKMADQHNFIAQEINQDRNYFQRFKKIMGANVKRSDYIILNLPDVEVDVKCLKTYTDNLSGSKYFILEQQEIERFKNYANQTGRKIVFAIYQRSNNGPNPQSLAMVELADLLTQKTEIRWNKEFVQIPLSLLKPQFSLLDQYANQKIPSQQVSCSAKDRTPSEENHLLSSLEEEFLLDNELLLISNELNHSRKNIVNRVTSWLSKFSKTTFMDLLLLPVFMLAMYVLSVSIKDSIVAKYTLYLQSGLSLLFFMLLLQSSKKHSLSSILTALVGGRVALNLTRNGKFLLFTKPYYILLTLMGVVGLFRYLKYRLE